jgi:hypothetical protein
MSGGNVGAAHSQLCVDIRLALGSKDDCRLFLNPRGLAKYWKHDGRPFAVPYGLAPGAADLIGIVKRDHGAFFKWLLRTFTPSAGIIAELFDKLAPVGVFLSIEVKTGDAVSTEKQKAWAKMVRDMGGVSGVARSVEDAIALYDEARGNR